jgi:hypothetical protein
MGFLRQYIPTMLGGIVTPQDTKTNLPPNTVAPSTAPAKPLTEIIASLDSAQKGLVTWISHFQNQINQIKLSEKMSPTATSVASDVKADADLKADPKALSTLLFNTKESLLHLPNTRLQAIFTRTMNEIQSDHERLCKLVNYSPLLFQHIDKENEKDKELKISQLGITIARKLRDMVCDFQEVMTQCLLDEELGEKLIPSVPIAQRVRELVDHALRKHIRETIDTMQDRVNKYVLDFMKIERIVTRKIENISKNINSPTPTNPESEADISLTLPSSGSTLG